MGIQDIAIAMLSHNWERPVLTSGWRDILRRISRAEGCDMGWFKYLPDGFLVVRQNHLRRVVAVEVEDSHPLTRDKLLAYADLWFDIDGTNWFTLDLVVTDRYGSPRLLPLETVYYASIPEKGPIQKAMRHVPPIRLEDIKRPKASLDRVMAA